VGFQGRGFAEVVSPHCCHPFLLEALLFSPPSIRRGASRTMVEHKPPESNKSVQPFPIRNACWLMSVFVSRLHMNVGLFAWSAGPWASLFAKSAGPQKPLFASRAN